MATSTEEIIAEILREREPRPSRELDWLIATVVLRQEAPEGYEWSDSLREWTFEEADSYEDGSPARSTTLHTWPPHYSRQMAQAMGLVNLWRGDFELKKQNDHWYATLYVPSHEYQGYGGEKYPALAVCLAALRARADHTWHRPGEIGYGG